MLRLTIRTRLTLTYSALVTGCAVALAAAVYLFMRYVPVYQIEAAERVVVPASPIGGVSAPRERLPDAIAIYDSSDFLDTLLLASAGALVLLISTGVLAAWLVSGRIVKPLAVINAAATRAATGTLDHRVALPGPRDEIRDLSDTFDRMLASLERAFAAHRRFAANASHELTTPLATTKTMLDVALDDPATDAGAFRRLAERLREVNRANIETVNALLDLANAQSGSLTRTEIDLCALIGDVVTGLMPEATAAGITLIGPAPDRDASPAALGDPILLRQAVSNLVRNAVRHNHPGGHAVVQLHATRVTVTNTGPVIPRAVVGTLVEPFVRGGGRTLTRDSGHGLGLAIVAAVATAHDATLTLHPNPTGGLTVHLTLPEACRDARRSPVHRTS
ncbi:sensor histidine kinase [Catenuloplanes atrovinosus]|uniref:histidine kinase n=1 Tax=Catenuloplanes atrovinosus TaxID=137266 RepID=A0AAE3YNG0_9ACTN|nr:HAMP domain-containing sensor histidine kinase [Catenuloplanes atrovinosus]MDR7277043.1 two-component system sensor histidine kinase VanS [Catenuloplanes atrovinosus]